MPLHPAPAVSTPLPCAARVALWLASTLCLSAGAQADTLLASPARTAIHSFLTTQTAGLPGQVSVQVSAPQTGPLPACTDGVLEAFLPAGTRAWGRISVGVRCQGGNPWTRYVPAAISVQGDYYVATRAISAGQLLGSADAEQRQGDLTALPASVVTDAAQWQGAQALNPVAPGAPIRRELLRSVALVQQGQNVKVLMRGAGFVITTEGKALTAAAAGTRLQVRLPNGQQITGLLGTDGQVERVQ